MNDNCVTAAGVPVYCCFIDDPDGAIPCKATEDLYELQFSFAPDYMDYSHACIDHLVKAIGNSRPVSIERMHPTRPMPEQVKLMMECFDVEAVTIFERLLQERLDTAIQMIGYVTPWTKRAAKACRTKHPTR